MRDCLSQCSPGGPTSWLQGSGAGSWVSSRSTAGLRAASYYLMQGGQNSLGPLAQLHSTAPKKALLFVDGCQIGFGGGVQKWWFLMPPWCQHQSGSVFLWARWTCQPTLFLPVRFAMTNLLVTLGGFCCMRWTDFLCCFRNSLYFNFDKLIIICLSEFIFVLILHEDLYSSLSWVSIPFSSFGVFSLVISLSHLLLRLP